MYEFEGGICSLHSSISTTPFDFRTTQFEGDIEVHDLLSINYVLQHFHAKCKNILQKNATMLTTPQLATVLSETVLKQANPEHVKVLEAFMYHPVQTITNMILHPQNSSRINLLHHTFIKLSKRNMINAMMCQQIIQMCIDSYLNDTDIIPGWIEDGKELLQLVRMLFRMMNKGLSKPQIRMIDEVAHEYPEGVCQFWHDCFFHFTATFGSIVMDVYVILCMLEDHLSFKNSVVLAGDTHIRLYNRILSDIFGASTSLLLE
jgi:hypothetical protein